MGKAKWAELEQARTAGNIGKRNWNVGKGRVKEKKQ